MINSSNSNSPAEIPSIPLDYQEYPVEEVQQRALEYYENMKRRRTVRDFSTRHVPLDIIENCIRTADTAPNGANQHPWHFVVVSDQEIKSEIRQAAEKRNRTFIRVAQVENGLKYSLRWGLMNTNLSWKLPLI